MPPNHELFESQSIAELNLEFFEDIMVRRKEILEDLENEDIKQEEAGSLYKQLNAVNKILGLEEVSSDPVVDEWERELLDGRVPDLERR